MAQYNKQNNSFLANGTSLFEVVMLADAEGNINTGGGNFSGTAVDAFGRARMSQPVTLFDSTNVGGLSNDFYNVTTGTGANVQHDTYYNAASLGISSNATPQHVVRRSKRRMSYQPGKSLLVMATFTMSRAHVGLTQKVGYYDDNDGVYLERTGDEVVNLVLRTSTGIDAVVPQSEWNGDKLNGNPEDSTSGFTLDLDKSQIFWCDIEWLGVGSVRCGFVINGQLIVAHTFHHSNIIEGTYMKQANLPITYEIQTDDVYASGATDLKAICATVISEGGYEAAGKEIVAGTSLAGNATNNANVFVNLITVRLNDLNTIAVITGLDVLNIANADFEWGLFKNATISGLTFGSSINSVDYDTTGNNLTDLGTRVAGGFLGGKTAPASFGSSNWDYQIGQEDASTSETYTLAVRATSSSKAAAGIIKWIEY